MKKHLYLMPVLALSMAGFALTGCDDKKDETATADAPLESSMPAAEVPAEAPAAEETQQQANPITVTEAHAYATAPSATNGAIFAKISNNSDTPDFLSRAQTDVAERVEIHQTSQDPQTGAMLMRSTAGVDISANGSASLTPDGYHIMLIGLKAPLTPGQTFDVTLSFRSGGEVIVPVTVMDVSGQDTGHDHSAHDAAPATASEATADATPHVSEDAAENAPVAQTPAEEAPIDGAVQQ